MAGRGKSDILDRIGRGRTDLVFDLLALPDWRAALTEGQVRALQWFVYYGDVTALKAVLAAGGDLSSIDLDAELGNAAFCGWWKVCDFLIAHGADVRFGDAATGETALHSALSKAGRPAYFHIVRLLVERGAEVNARTKAGAETGAFMRDVRNRGETPLHRAAAFADAGTIAFLIERGADRTIKDAQGDTPLSWASWHLRPGAVLRLLAHGPHQVSESSAAAITSDHGQGWGYGMERKALGDFLPESLPVGK
ncbi:MAG: ankyrin repeat domain-containing protein [Parvularculaceae bacterium]